MNDGSLRDHEGLSSGRMLSASGRPSGRTETPKKKSREPIATAGKPNGKQAVGRQALRRPEEDQKASVASPTPSPALLRGKAGKGAFHVNSLMTLVSEFHPMDI
jgi:hypothetical protein